MVSFVVGPFGAKLNLAVKTDADMTGSLLQCDE